MKLKSLTLLGFKSFANKTAFDFPDGVTCVVGPNGCGKSNVVDAFKWVLGEQSAKSLRGGEMMDVVFNGTAQRRSAGYAEVALTFEDSAGVLADRRPAVVSTAQADEPKTPDAQAVVVARRLYRSGESEYLINRQPVRLKDVRNMFMDTGIGVNAYSLIEQGKVETFLQASTADRRSLFDEAAGISKYKARKKEALRRLERVEQNLFRLTDILGEVQKRLRSIKYQAGKARSYRQHSARLKELQSLFSLAEYHRLSARRRELQGGCDGLTDSLAGVTARIDKLEASRTAADTEIADLQQKVHSLDARLAEVTTQAVACQQRAEMLDQRARELTDTITTDTARCQQQEARVQDNARELDASRRRQQDLAGRLAEMQQADESLARQHSAARQALTDLGQRLEDEKNGTIDLLRRTAQLHNEINTHSLRRENLHVQRERLSGRTAEIDRSLEDLLARRAALQVKLGDVQGVLADSQTKLDEAHAEKERLGQAERQLTEGVSRLQLDHSAISSRQAALKEMLDRLEGVGEGVRRVLTAARAGRLPWLRGMLGELIETDVEHAPVIQAALAGAEQRLVADRLDDVLEAMGSLREVLGADGGVELVCLDQVAARQDWAARPVGEGVIGRAADLVRCDAALSGAVRDLLGRTLVVDSLQRALALRRQLPSWRFVTTAGELLEADGRIRIGAAAGGTGVIGRKSELAELGHRLADIDRRVHELNLKREHVAARRAHAESLVKALRTAVYEATTERVEHQKTLEQLNGQVSELKREAPLLAEEVRQLAEEIGAAVRREHEAKEKAAELEELRRQREAEVKRLHAAIEEATARNEELSGRRTESQVALAEGRQQRDALGESLQRLTRTGEALQQELLALRRQIAQSRDRRQEAGDNADEARRKAQTLMLEKTTLAAEAEETAESRRSLEQRLGEIRNQLTHDRKAHDGLAQKLNALRLQLGEVEVRIETLLTRSGDELGLDLVEGYASYEHDEKRDWDAVREEISELRGKIDRLGNVNLDAIEEQDELQQRQEFLTTQTDDVRASEKKIAGLIRRINAESRRRFEETFEAVRQNFGELFRKLFGGGRADILLLEPENVLESGIEVVARPPGKELRSITLLSGGEKTLTALALMFSFFKSRPSPFCLLDEVDAALDEPNTERFTKLVREFLHTSQFVIISHAKRTIAMADQIYGVTMQQPGVSTRISVRFEDAGEYLDPDAAPQTAGAPETATEMSNVE